MKDKAVMQPGVIPTEDDEHQVEVQPVVKSVGQVITIVEGGEHPKGRGHERGAKDIG